MDSRILQDYGRVILESSPEAITVLNRDGIVIFAGPATKTVLGYDPDQLAGQSLPAFVAPEYQEALADSLGRVRETGMAGEISYRFLRGDGRWIMVESAIASVRSDGGGHLFVLHSHDITVRDKIAQSLKLFSSAVDQIDEAVVLTDREGIIQYVNKAFERATGFTADEAVGRTPRILKSGKVEGSVYETMWQTILSGRSYHGVLINRKKDGTLYHEDKTITPVFDASGTVTHFVAIGTDVTRQKMIEEKLFHGAERFALSLRGANDGLWDWDFRTGRIHFSSRWKSMLGYEPHEVEDGPEDWFNLVHHEDLAELKTQIKSHISGMTPHLEHEHRIRQKDGSYAWVLTRGQAVRDDTGKAFRIAGSQTDITLRKRAEAQLAHDALHDALTGLPNRTLFMDRLCQACHRAKRSADKRCALLFMDLDRFKVINDSLGHLAGDQLLRQVSGRVQSCVRTSDTVARMGGDEFAVLLEEIQADLEATAFAQRILEQMATPFQIEGHDVYTSGSIGIAVFDALTSTPDDMLRNADAAMYHAKDQGRSRSALFDVAMHSRALETLELETDLRKAIEDNALVVHYQPVVALSTGHIAGFEALVRWPHAKRGLVLPGGFIHIAEENGLIFSLGLFVLREACRHLKLLQSKFYAKPPLFMSVNLSGLQFLRPEFLGHVELLLREFALDPQTLILEITEAGILSHSEQAQQMMAQLKMRHLKLALDNFGTGYSSMANLRRYPIDTLKVDRSFVGSMLSDEYSRELVRSTISMAQNMKMEVVAEGIETVEHLNALKTMNCSFGQGFYFSRALDASSTEALLAKGWLW